MHGVVIRWNAVDWYEGIKLQACQNAEDNSRKCLGGRVLMLPTFDHEVLGSNPPGGRIQLITVRYFIAQNLLLSPFRHINMT